jgi:hypothetical protein
VRVNVREAAIELRWFFTEADGELGLRAMSLEPGAGGGDPERAAARQTLAYLRWTKVNGGLRAVGGTMARVLRVAYTPHRWVGLERWYELAGVAAMLTDREDVTDAGRRVAKLATPEADKLRAEARRVLRDALRSFVEAV